MNSRLGFATLALSLCFTPTLSFAAETTVTPRRAPDDGIQPQAVLDERGTLHLVYFKGPAGGGDLFYVRADAADGPFSAPTIVNSEPGSAIAAGTIRGAQIAVGHNGRVNVAWNGANSVPGANYPGVPQCYTRLNESGKTFEPQRNLITYAGGLDGGGSITTDAQGVVRVFWHGAPATNTLGEPGRALFMATSTDDGKTFATETPISPAGSGACGCCGMKAFCDRAGNVFALFRSAPTKMDRDELLIGSRDGGRSFQTLARSPWKIASCPMSSAAFCESSSGVVAAWETSGQIEWARIDTATFKVSPANSVPGTGRRKHPVVAANSRGEILIAWTEGTGWQKGGALAWQVFDADGKPTPTKGRVADAVPVWGLLSAIARPDGSFVIFH